MPESACLWYFLFHERKNKRKEERKMRGNKKVLWGVLTLLLVLGLSTLTAFAGDEAAEYVPKCMLQHGH